MDINVERLKLAAGVKMLSQIKESDYQRAVTWIDHAIAAKRKGA